MFYLLSYQSSLANIMSGYTEECKFQMNGTATAFHVTYHYECITDMVSPVFQVGDEAGKAKTAPLKMKVQLMLQVPQDDIKSSALMFRVKKRWDI